jgi:hypothetical protein
VRLYANLHKHAYLDTSNLRWAARPRTQASARRRHCGGLLGLQCRPRLSRKATCRRGPRRRRSALLAGLGNPPALLCRRLPAMAACPAPARTLPRWPLLDRLCWQRRGRGLGPVLGRALRPCPQARGMSSTGPRRALQCRPRAGADWHSHRRCSLRLAACSGEATFAARRPWVASWRLSWWWWWWWWW